MGFLEASGHFQGIGVKGVDHRGDLIQLGGAVGVEANTDRIVGHLFDTH